MNTIWDHKDSDIVEMYKKEDFIGLLEYTMDNNNLLSYKIYEENNDELEKTLRLGNAILHRFDRYVVNNDNIKTIF